VSVPRSIRIECAGAFYHVSENAETGENASFVMERVRSAANVSQQLRRHRRHKPKLTPK
jgi:hypothetical protein